MGEIPGRPSSVARRLTSGPKSGPKSGQIDRERRLADDLVEDKPNGRHRYRTLAFDRQALLERNYIDYIVVLHERSPQEAEMRDSATWGPTRPVSV